MTELEILKAEMEELKAQRKALSQRILKLWYQINYLEKQRPFRRDNRDTVAYKKFGKHYSELTDEELKEYNRDAQRRYRESKKGDNN